MTHRIEPGQEYEAHNRADNSTIRIRVIEPQRTPGGPVGIATVTEDGRELRRRRIAARQLHDNPARRSGYRLVRHADGSPAGGAQ